MSALLPLLALAFSWQPYRVRYPFPLATVPDGFGVNAHFKHPSEAEVARLRAVGFRWVRTDLLWTSVEKQRGVYDFESADRLLERLTKAGLRVWWIFAYDNPLYGKGAPIGGEARTAYLRFVSATAAHFAHRGVIWEIWNEPDIEKFWHTSPNPYDYTAIAVEAATAIRKASSEEYVVGPAASAFDWSYLNRSMQAGLLDAVDALSVHPYRPSPPESVLSDYRQLQALIHWARPRRDIPVLAGEWGYGLDGQVDDERTQAEYMARIYLTNLVAGVPITILYNWTDSPPAPGEKFIRYGVTVDGTEVKLPYSVLQGIIESLNGARFVRRLPSPAGTDLLLFVRGGKRIVVGYSESGSVEVDWEGTKITLNGLPRVLERF